MLIIFCLVLLAYKCQGQDSLSWVCQSGIGIEIEDQQYLSGHIVAGSVILRNIHADSFKITVRDSVFIDSNCVFDDLEIVIYDCTEQTSQPLTEIDWIDSALLVINRMRIATQTLDQDSCYISGQIALHLQISDIMNDLFLLIEARDSIEAGATGRNLDIFNFLDPYIEADMDQIEDYVMRYVALLYSDTCERVENRLHGRLVFIRDSLYRLKQNFNSLKDGWI